MVARQTELDETSYVEAEFTDSSLLLEQVGHSFSMLLEIIFVKGFPFLISSGNFIML